MSTKSLLLTALFVNIVFVVSNAQISSENYLLFDAACMKKVDYIKNSEYLENTYREYQLKVNDKKTYVFRVNIDSQSVETLNSLEKTPIKCSDILTLNDDFISKINSSKLSLTILEFNSNKNYSVLSVKKAFVTIEDEEEISLYGADLNIKYNKKLTLPGVNLDSSGGRTLYLGDSKNNCTVQHQFRVFDKSEPRFYEDFYYAENIGLVKKVKAAAILEISKINGLEIKDYNQEYCDKLKNKKDSKSNIDSIALNDKKDSLKTVIKKDSVPAITIKLDSMGLNEEGLYIVQEKDNLSIIAKKFKTTIDILMEINNMQTPNLVKGQKLKIKNDGTFKDDNPVVREDVKTGKKTKIHVVRQGETLSIIARKYNTTAKNLQEINALSTDKLNIRQEIIIEFIK
jgi:LysM repeat protein